MTDLSFDLLRPASPGNTNPFDGRISARRALARVVLFAAAALAVLVLLDPLCARLITVVSGISSSGGNARELDVVSVTFRWVDVVLVVLVMKGAAWREGASLRDAYGLPLRVRALRQWGFGAVVGIIGVVAVCGSLAATHGMVLGAPLLSVQAATVSGLRWGMAFLAVAALEELLFRGYALFALARGIGFWPATMVLSVLFTAAHLRNAGETLPGLAAVFLFGVLFCVLARRTGALWLGIGLHAGWDWAQSFLFGVPDSGTSASGRLFAPSFGGPAWIAGGTAGPEGSVITLGLLIIAILIVERSATKPQSGTACST